MAIDRGRAVAARPAGGSLGPAVLAFDVGGTRIKAGIVDGATVHALTIAPTDDEAGAAGVIATLLALGRRLLGAGDAPAVGAVGIGLKGIVDPARGILLDVRERLTGLIGLSLGDIIGAEFGLPTVVENDARMYAVGELVHGAGRGHANMVCLTLGTGVGCGVAVGGRVLRGPRGLGGILGGHVTVQLDGPPCACGNVGCLEALIGGAGLIRAADALAAGPGDGLASRAGVAEPRQIFAAAAAGDAMARAVVARFGQILAAGVVSLINAHDPDIVVLGGGLMRASPLFLPAVRADVSARAWTLPRGRARVAPARLGDAAALVGVAEFARRPEVVL